ncbi:MAG: FMN-binding negative transcriptional regulator [Bacteroidota bacterium]
MYVPKQYQKNDKTEVIDFIRKNGFAILVSQVEGKLWGTHIPLMVSPDETKLYGHISRANPQWKDFNAGSEVLAIFNGPHAYVSSSWYDHENVPTWNYIAVHVYGTIRIMEGEEVLDALRHLTDKYEKQSARPVSVDGMSPEYVKREMRGLVGFEISITNMEAAYKLSQNRDEKNHREIISQLEKTGHHDSIQVAEEMKRNIPPTHKYKTV